MEIIPVAIIIVASVIGLCLCLYIHHKKAHGEVLVCPINSDCNKVIRSDYSRIMGIPLETIGSLYYGGTAIFYIASLSMPEIFARPETIPLLIWLSSVALIFSIILTAIQAFIIREWCVWCLGSAFLTFLIFFVEIFALGFITL